MLIDVCLNRDISVICLLYILMRCLFDMFIDFDEMIEPLMFSVFSFMLFLIIRIVIVKNLEPLMPYNVGFF